MGFRKKTGTLPGTCFPEKKRNENDHNGGENLTKPRAGSVNCNRKKKKKYCSSAVQRRRQGKRRKEQRWIKSTNPNPKAKRKGSASQEIQGFAKGKSQKGEEGQMNGRFEKRSCNAAKNERTRVLRRRFGCVARKQRYRKKGLMLNVAEGTTVEKNVAKWKRRERKGGESLRGPG